MPMGPPMPMGPIPMPMPPPMGPPIIPPPYPPIRCPDGGGIDGTGGAPCGYVAVACPPAPASSPSNV